MPEPVGDIIRDYQVKGREPMIFECPSCHAWIGLDLHHDDCPHGPVYDSLRELRRCKE